MLGFETIGNATVIVYDGKPVLATDPWINRDAYFGSWGSSHEIPTEQMGAIKGCKYIWISHGHPDHLNLDSITDLSDKEILLADHRGSRIKNDLSGMGFKVRVLPERTWLPLSTNVRILTLSDRNQDSICLIEVRDILIINLNDASDNTWGRFVKSIAKKYSTVYLTRLWGFGDADMINLFTESGERIGRPARERRGLANTIQADAVNYGATFAIPSSSFHRYQREDSVWANERTTPIEMYTAGQAESLPPVLPPFIRVDAITKQYEEIRPKSCAAVVRKPEDFGDHWGDRLEANEKQMLRDYFSSKEMVREKFGFLRFRVGGEETIVDLNKKRREVGVTFEVPRQSLVSAVQYRVFDDLLIGNFMKTTLHGVPRLYPNFTPYVAKYADNGGAESKKQLREYFHHYFRRDPVGTLFRDLEQHSEMMFRKFVPRESVVFRAAKKLYWRIQGI